MISAILRKLSSLLNTGITNEHHVVYLMRGIRIIMEQQEAKGRYRYLNFHFDWALHSKLDGAAAQAILRHFDAANLHLKNGLKLPELPGDLRRKIDDISQMRRFEMELESFLKENNLPPITATRHDGWIYFLHLYCKVIEDCPLVISGKKNRASSIESVTVKIEMPREPVGDEMLFQVRWIVLDKNGLNGEIFIVNSFSLNPDAAV